MRLDRLSRLWAFDRRRFKIFAALLAAIYALAFFGVSAGIFVPILGTFFFLGGLFIWYLPGVLFAWTGFFEFHEFGAAPSGVLGYVVMFLFYTAIATIATWPFAPKRE
jgi:hypothetical protein